MKVLLLLRLDLPGGGVRRISELLRRGRKYGIEYIILTDKNMFERAKRYFQPSYIDELKDRLLIYYIDSVIDTSFLRFNIFKMVKKTHKLAALLARIARMEDVDLNCHHLNTLVLYFLLIWHQS